MLIEGKIVALGQEKGGISQRTGNAWKNKEYVLEVPGMFTRKMSFMVKGEDRIKDWDLQLYDEVRLEFEIDAHEYQGRWYNEVSAYKCTFINASAGKNKELNNQPTAQPQTQQQLFGFGGQPPMFDASQYPAAPPANGNGDMPF